MQDQVIVITGASDGIGAALARLVARRGAKPVLVARRKDALDAVAKGCGPHALAVPADVTERAQVEGVVQRALAAHGRIDVWVNNVGRGITRPVSQLTDGDLDEMMKVNVKSALYGMQAVLPHFQSRDAGHVINVSSMLGRVPFAGIRSAYSASKHFLNALTANLRMELKATHPGIAVTLVSPGVVATGFGLNSLHGGMDSRALPNSQTADEVAEVIAGAIASRKADVYTRAGMQQQVVAYYAAEDITAVEAQFAFPPPKR